MSVSIALHILASVIWVGGMFFAYIALRPAAAQVLEPPQRLSLWIESFKRFFVWVWLSIFVLIGTGYWMVFSIFGGFNSVGLHVHLMHGMGIVMMLIFFHVYFAPYRRLRHAVIIEDYPEGGRRLGQIRMLVGLNLTIGLLVIAIASAGRYL
ncbi:MAG: CopD family protein [Gammaproteobacteria bacterium]